MRTGSMWGIKQLSSGASVVQVGGSGPAPHNLPFRPRGKKMLRETGGTWTLGRIEGFRQGGEEQRPAAVREIREEGYCEDHAPPWALHTHVHLKHT